jgi:hypothetical protein
VKRDNNSKTHVMCVNTQRHFASAGSTTCRSRPASTACTEAMCGLTESPTDGGAIGGGGTGVRGLVLGALTATSTRLGSGRMASACHYHSCTNRGCLNRTEPEQHTHKTI